MDGEASTIGKRLLETRQTISPEWKRNQTFRQLFTNPRRLQTDYRMHRVLAAEWPPGADSEGGTTELARDHEGTTRHKRERWPEWVSRGGWQGLFNIILAMINTEEEGRLKW